MKVLIFDTGPLITLASNGLLYILRDLKKNFDGKFLITNEVKYEIIERPLKVPRFEFEALRVKELLNDKVLEMASDFDVEDNEIKPKLDELMDVANHLIKMKGSWVKIVSDAEISCLALSSKLSERDIENLIVVDERTTRILSEKPKNLEKLMSHKLRQNVTLEKNNFSAFKDYRFIRSAELAYVACKKRYIKVDSPKVLEAVLYATKFHGCAISFDEIKEMKKL